MPMSDAFKQRLWPQAEKIAQHFGTPFHIYDEVGIRETGEALKQAFTDVPVFKEYFAVKATPNMRILNLMQDLDFGFDCSSIPELIMSRRVGASGNDIMFTSNNTTQEEFQQAAIHGGCILNLDDISLIPKVPEFPELICFRYNPGPRRSGNVIIGNPVEAKYGVSHDQLPEAYRQAMARGAKRFGLHTMVASNELDYQYIVETARMLLEQAARLEDDLGIRFEFLNIGGGLGIPYEPQQEPLNLPEMGRQITALMQEFAQNRGYMPNLYMESGRFITGPHGVLVSRAINRKEIYRTYVGVDACMSALMRPGMYDTYHHIDVIGKDATAPQETVDVVGSLCENIDKFAVQRQLPAIDNGDLITVQDSGAHGYAMGFTYNGRLRPQELLLRADGSVERIRRAETVSDYLATQNFVPEVYQP